MTSADIICLNGNVHMSIISMSIIVSNLGRMSTSFCAHLDERVWVRSDLYRCGTLWNSSVNMGVTDRCPHTFDHVVYSIIIGLRCVSDMNICGNV